LTKTKTQTNATNITIYLTNSSIEELIESEKTSKTAWGTNEIEAFTQYEFAKSFNANVNSGEWYNTTTKKS
jgi:PKD repeat protein